MKFDFEEIPTGGQCWTVHLEMGPGLAHFEETWLGTFDEVYARFYDRVHELTGAKKAVIEPAPEPVVEAPAPVARKSRANAPVTATPADGA